MDILFYKDLVGIFQIHKVLFKVFSPSESYLDNLKKIRVKILQVWYLFTKKCTYNKEKIRLF